jgi:hypothetical protein
MYLPNHLPLQINEYSTVWCPQRMNQFRGFLHRLAFPVFSTRFFDRFFDLHHIDFTENIYRILIQTNWPKQGYYSKKKM